MDANFLATNVELADSRQKGILYCNMKRIEFIWAQKQKGKQIKKDVLLINEDIKHRKS